MSDEPGDEPQNERWPFTFVVLIIAAALYLLLRLIQGIGWLAGRIGG